MSYAQEWIFCSAADVESDCSAMSSKQTEPASDVNPNVPRVRCHGAEERRWRELAARPSSAESA